MKMRRDTGGFTLVELVTVILIASILMAVAVPSYKYVTTSNRLSSEVNGLLGDMQFARYEAIKEGQTITVCPSTDGATCTATNTWNSGWIVQTTSGGVTSTLRLQRAFGNTDSFTSNGGVQAFQFNREGFTTGLAISTEVLTLHDSTSNSAYTRCLAVGIAGVLTTQTHASSPSTCT